MSELNKIDEMLEQVVAGQMSSTSMNDFDRMAMEASGNNDNLVQMADSMGYYQKTAQSKTGYARTYNKPLEQAECRYDYFMASLASITYNPNLSQAYRIGHQLAVDRYIGKVELNRNNLSIVEKTVAQELIRVGRNGENVREMPASLNTPMARTGYYEGLKLIYEFLTNSKNAMMVKVSNQVLAVLNK